jgi:SAM-dependent methyltransferase
VPEEADAGVIASSRFFTYDFTMPAPMSHAPNPDAASSVGKKVRTFYEDCSFPDYDEWDTPGTLIAKAQRSGFAKWLDEQVAFGSRVLEVGCGTGQLAVFLSLANRKVVATDFSMGSLRKGWSFARRHRIANLSMMQMNLFSLALREEAFDYVVYIVIGLYNRVARMPTNLRRRLMRIFGKSMHKLDPIVRKKLRDEHRQKVWLADQYYHPHETQHTVDEVLGWFEESGVEFISAIPPVAFGVPINAPLFRPQPKGGRPRALAEAAAVDPEPRPRGRAFYHDRAPEKPMKKRSVIDTNTRIGIKCLGGHKNC